MTFARWPFLTEGKRACFDIKIAMEKMAISEWYGLQGYVDVFLSVVILIDSVL